MKGRTIPVLGASFWILGLILFVVGLNVSAPAGSWLTVSGSILFLAGLALEGVHWLKRDRNGKDGKA